MSRRSGGSSARLSGDDYSVKPQNSATFPGKERFTLPPDATQTGSRPPERLRLGMVASPTDKHSSMDLVRKHESRQLLGDVDPFDPAYDEMVVGMVFSDSSMNAPSPTPMFDDPVAPSRHVIEQDPAFEKSPHSLGSSTLRSSDCSPPVQRGGVTGSAQDPPSLLADREFSRASVTEVLSTAPSQPATATAHPSSSRPSPA